MSLMAPNKSEINDTQRKALDKWTVAISDEAYRSITNNIDSFEIKSLDFIESKIDKWIDYLLESDDVYYAINHDSASFRIFVIDGQPEIINNQGASNTSIMIDYPIKDLGVQARDGEWWLRLEIIANDTTDIKHAFEDVSGLNGVENSSLYKRLVSSRRYAVPGNTLISTSVLRDPVSIGVGIERTIPYTYSASVEQSAIYLETLLFDGWNIDRVERGAYYLDFYLKKNEAESRIIILDGSLKVFYWGTHR